MPDSVKRESRWYMVTVIGVDRPGIVARLTGALYEGGCNLGEASMARLGGNFAILLMVEGADSGALRRIIEPVVEEMGLKLHVDAIDAALHRHQEPNVQISVHGADRPGIVAQVTGALARIGFNVFDLYSDVGGTADRPIYIIVMDGHIAGGPEAVEAAVAPLRAGDIEIRVAALDTLIG